MFLTTMSFFSDDSPEKRTLAARAKTHAQRAACAVEKHFSLGEGVAFFSEGSRAKFSAFQLKKLRTAKKACQQQA